MLLAVAIATATSRALSYGTIYTTKLLRRGTDIDHLRSADLFEELTAADAMRPFAAPVTIAAGPPGPPGRSGPARAPLPGPVTQQRNPQVLFAGESLAQALRQLELYGRDGLPVLSSDGQHLQGWITSQNVLQAVSYHLHNTPAGAAQAQPHGPQADLREAPTRYAATRSWKSPSPQARPPPDGHSATSPGRTCGSPSRSWTTAPSATPAPASPSPPATGSICSPANRRQSPRDPKSYGSVTRRRPPVRRLVRCGAYGSGSADHCRFSLTEGAGHGQAQMAGSGQ